MTEGRIDYDRWYPEVPAVMGSKQLAKLLNTKTKSFERGFATGLSPRIGSPVVANSLSSP